MAVKQDRHCLEGAIACALEVGACIRASPFEVCFDRTGSFRHPDGRYPFVVQSGEQMTALIGFRRTLAGHMVRAGLAVESSYTPHITLLWDDRRVKEYPLLPIRWTVRELVLILSHTGQSRHSHLGRWALN